MLLYITTFLQNYTNKSKQKLSTVPNLEIICSLQLDLSKWDQHIEARGSTAPNATRATT